MKRFMTIIHDVAPMFFGLSFGLAISGWTRWKDERARADEWKAEALRTSAECIRLKAQLRKYETLPAEKERVHSY